MKIVIIPKVAKLASALLTTLVVLSILSLFVMYYLSLAEQQSNLNARSQAWNMAIAVSEAGVEEGLQQLNNNTFNLTADGWASPSGGIYTMDRTLPDGSSYTVKLDLSYDPFNPTISCRANVVPPRLAGGPPTYYFAQAGAPVLGPSTLSRASRVRCTRGNLLIKGMVAKHLIDMNGNDILTDSFDSTDPRYCTAGHYDAAKAGDNGDVATNEKIANGITGGMANIYGHVTTGPGGSVAVGSEGGVGSHAWQAAHPGTIEDGCFTDDANFTFPDQLMPYIAGLPPLGGTVVLTNYSINTNAIIGSTTYPTNGAVGVSTNVTYITTPTWPNMPGTTTNCSSTVKSGKNFPAAGTYCGNPWHTGQSDNNSSAWNWYTIASYTYPLYTYSYDLYTTSYTVTTNYFDHILYNGNYVVDTLSGTTLVLGHARLVVLNGISMSGNDVIQIAQGGSLELYVGGSSSTIAGNGIINQAGFASDCKIYCTPTVTDLDFKGNGEFIGVVVAPEAHVTMDGGGHLNNDFIGAIMCDSVTMNGHYSFHYDEALGKNAVDGRFIIGCWDEVDPRSF